MVAVEDVLNDSLSTCIGAWFEPTFSHPFLDLQTHSVPDSVKPIPKCWVDEVEIGEGFGEEGFGEGDLLAEGPGGPLSWGHEEGQRRLGDALIQLDMTEDHVAHPNVHRMNRQELSAEKRRVKQELKRYDAEFRKQFARLPTHSEKEPMRPLYVYYRRLKSMITQAESSNPKIRRSGSGSDDDRPPFAGQGEHLATVHEEKETLRQGASHQRGNNAEQIHALEARIQSLQNEKGAVRVKLQAFQEKFVTENSRKIRFHKDILPIEREYRMYKNLKEDIAKAEMQLRDLRAAA